MIDLFKLKEKGLLILYFFSKYIFFTCLLQAV